MKKPFLHASGAALYIIFIVTLLQVVSSVFKEIEGTFAVPMTMLSLFVLSAAVMGYFFLSESVFLLFENKKKEAIMYFAKVVGFFACYALLFAILILLNATPTLLK